MIYVSDSDQSSNIKIRFNEFMTSHYPTIAFQTACLFGELTEAQRLVTQLTKADVSANNECAFRYACRHNDTTLAKWLLEQKPDINISANDNEAFRWACENGKFEMMRWLLETMPDILSSIEPEFILHWSLNTMNNSEILVWLLKTKPEIFRSIEPEIILYWTAENRGEPCIMKWMFQIYPELTAMKVMLHKIYQNEHRFVLKHHFHLFTWLKHQVDVETGQKLKKTVQMLHQCEQSADPYSKKNN